MFVDNDRTLFMKEAIRKCNPKLNRAGRRLEFKKIFEACGQTGCNYRSSFLESGGASSNAMEYHQSCQSKDSEGGIFVHLGT
jgi:hypothetical protein